MNVILRVDEAWPDGGTRIGVRERVIADPDSLSDPEVWNFDARHVVLTPGWVCAHAHLERSGWDPDPDPADFITRVRRYDEAVQRPGTDLQAAYRSGADSLIRSGICRVVDHCRQIDRVGAFVAELPLAVHRLVELEGFSESARTHALERARRYLREENGNNATPRGVAPRGPWCVHPDLLFRLGRLTREKKALFSMHLHASEPELEFAREGKGPLWERLRRRERTDLPPNPYAGSPIPALVSGGLFRRTAFGVHLRHLDARDRRWVEASRIVPVVCPAQDRRIAGEAGLDRSGLLENTAFALGVGGPGDPAGPDMLHQLRVLGETHPNTDPDRILGGLTTVPTRVMGTPGRGVLTSGTVADFSLFDAPGGSDRLARGEAEALAVVRGGRIVWEKRGVRSTD